MFPRPYSEWRDPSGLRFCLLYYTLLVRIDEAECGLSTHACNVLWCNLVPLFLLPLPLFLFLISGIHFSFGGIVFTIVHWHGVSSFGFQIWERRYSPGLSLSVLFRLTQYPQIPSILLQTTGTHSPLWWNNLSLYIDILFPPWLVSVIKWSMWQKWKI